jgi:PIN domain nuclease of toxin-antitoxin system
VNLLLDTQALIWFLEGDEKCSDVARSSITNAENQNFVSYASLWEMAIKIGLGKLDLSKSLAEIYVGIVDNGIQILPSRVEHTWTVADLPFYHRDPFDRFIIAQSLTESISVIGTDKIFERYGVNLLW